MRLLGWVWLRVRVGVRVRVWILVRVRVRVRVALILIMEWKASVWLKSFVICPLICVQEAI